MIGSMPKVSARPKVIFTMWLTGWGTKHELIDFWKGACKLIHPKCALCKIENETKDRDFFLECRFSKRVWSKLMNWLQVQWHISIFGLWSKWYILIMYFLYGGEKILEFTRMGILKRPVIGLYFEGMDWFFTSQNSVCFLLVIPRDNSFKGIHSFLIQAINYLVNYSSEWQ